MSNAQKLFHTVVCLAVLSVVSIPLYTTVKATEQAKVDRQADRYLTVADAR